MIEFLFFLKKVLNIKIDFAPTIKILMKKQKKVKCSPIEQSKRNREIVIKEARKRKRR